MYYMVTCLRNFESVEIKQGYSISLDIQNSYMITKKHLDVLKIITNNNYIAYVGSATFQEIASNFFAIKVFNSTTLNEDSKYTLLSNFLQYLGAYCQALWFIKDNAVTPSMGTISSDIPGESNNMIRRNVFITDAVGTPEKTSFTKKELDEALKWYSKIINISAKKGNGSRKATKGYDNLSQMITFDVSSYQRSLYFLDSARRADFLLTKITNYISVLECLLAANGDNTHKVSERAAFLIGHEVTDRKKIFKQIVGAYDLRSKYVHGSEIKQSKHEQFPEASKNLDDIVRRVLKELILNHPELDYNNSNKKDKTRKNFDEVNEWFNELVLTKGV